MKYLLATKIIQFRPKDTMDLHNLHDLYRDMPEKLNLEEVKNILGYENQKNFSRFLSLVKNH